MDQIEEFTDERLKGSCIHCGGWLIDKPTNRDHVPSKNLLVRPLPVNLPVVEVCRTCNEGFSLDEEYLIAFIGSVLSGSTVPEKQILKRSSRILEKKPSLRARIEKTKTEQYSLFGGLETNWEPEIDRVNRIILKNSRGHAFYEYGEPMLDPPATIWVSPLTGLTPEQRADFENVNFSSAWPEVGSRMMTRVLTGQDLSDGWVVVQDGVYRYAVDQIGAMTVRTVLYEYLATEVYWDD